MCAFLETRVIDQFLQVFNGAVHEDTFGVVTRRVFWDQGIGAGGKDEDIVGDYFAGGAGDEFFVRVEGGYFGVEVVV